MPITLGANPFPFPNITKQASNCIQLQPQLDATTTTCSPHVRLFIAPTKSFLARKCSNPGAPNDSLDIALSASYDHTCQWWAPFAATKVQYPTYRLLPACRCQQNKKCASDIVVDISDSSGVERTHFERSTSVVNHESYRNYDTHVDCHISGPHASTSARGFGRGIDGLFYNS